MLVEDSDEATLQAEDRGLLPCLRAFSAQWVGEDDKALMSGTIQAIEEAQRFAASLRALVDGWTKTQWAASVPSRSLEFDRDTADPVELMTNQLREYAWSIENDGVFDPVKCVKVMRDAAEWIRVKCIATAVEESVR